MIRKLLNRKNPAKKNSYSQSGEDLIIQFIFESKGIKLPSYLDIGANHPFNLNNTAIFYQKGARGINVEPAKREFQMFEPHRPEDTNLNVGIGPEAGMLKYFEMENSRLNTFSEEEVKTYVEKEGLTVLRQSEVQVLTIQQVLEQYCNGVFPDFMSVDTEGLDFEIVKSIDFEANYPKVVCLETLTFSASGKGEKRYNLIEYMKSQGYWLYGDTYINSIFVKNEFYEN